MTTGGMGGSMDESIGKLIFLKGVTELLVQIIMFEKVKLPSEIFLELNNCKELFFLLKS